MTQLCEMPRCAIPGRHRPGCDDTSCPGCLPRTTDEGRACPVCVGRAAAQLEAIIDLVPDARAVAAGLVQRGSGAAGGKPGSRSPGNDDALDALDAVTNALTTIARDIAETRGLTFGRDGRSRPMSAPVAAENRSGVPESTPRASGAA